MWAKGGHSPAILHFRVTWATTQEPVEIMSLSELSRERPTSQTHWLSIEPIFWWFASLYILLFH